MKLLLLILALLILPSFATAQTYDLAKFTGANGRKAWVCKIWADHTMTQWGAAPPAVPIPNNIANQNYAKEGFWRAQALFEQALVDHAVANVSGRNAKLTKGRQLIGWGLTCLDVESSDGAGDRCFNYYAAMDCYLRWNGLTAPDGAAYWSSAQINSLKSKLTASTKWNTGFTPNHFLMYQTGRFLASKAWPTATFASGIPFYGNPNTNGREAILKNITEFSQRCNGFEWDSPTYLTAYQMCYRSLADLTTGDSTMVTRAQMMFEWLLIRTAGAWNAGHWCSASLRTYTPFAAQIYDGGGANWLFLGGERSHSPELAIFCVRQKQKYTDTFYNTDITTRNIIKLAQTRSADPFLHTSYASSYGGGGYTPQDRWYQSTFMTPQWSVFSVADDLGATAPGLGWSEQAWRGGMRFLRGGDVPSTVYVNHPIQTPLSNPIENTDQSLGITNYERILQHRGTLLQVYNIPTTGSPVPYQAVIAKVAPGWIAASDHSANGGGPWGRIALHYGNVMVWIKFTQGFVFDPTVPGNNSITEFRVGGSVSGGMRKLAVVIETANPADFPGATAQAQLDAFDAAMEANTFNVSGLTAAKPLVIYTTRDGTKMTLEFDTVHKINDVPVDYSKWRYLDNPWSAQAVNTTLASGAGKLELADPYDSTIQRVTYDFTAGTKTVAPNPHIWIEAEEAAGGPGFPNFQLRGDGNASQARYIEVSNGPGADTGTAYYPFTVPSGGATVSVWLRTRADPLQGSAGVGANDSFTLDINGDGRPPKEFNGAATGITWTWVLAYDKVPLSAGSFNFQVACREDGTQLDRILLTTDSGYNPNTDDARK
jgi:hypothetical protein